MKFNIEKSVQVFNIRVLPRLKDGMSSSELSSILAENGFPYKCFWGLALEEAGYIIRGKNKNAKSILFDDDPAVPGRKKPLHKNQLSFAWEVIKKRQAEAESRKKEKYVRMRNIVDSDKITEESAVAFLKTLGYRIMRPTTTYEEV